MKSSKATIAQRIDQVVTLRIKGKPRAEIVRYASETDKETGRPWKVGERQIEDYIRRADELIVSQLEHERAKRFALAVARREVLYAKAFEADDVRSALAVLKDLSELLGDYPKSVNELAAEVERLMAQIEEQHVNRQITAQGAQAESQGGRRNGHGEPLPESRRISQVAAD